MNAAGDQAKEAVCRGSSAVLSREFCGFATGVWLGELCRYNREVDIVTKPSEKRHMDRGCESHAGLQNKQ